MKNKKRTPWNKGLKGIHLSPRTEFKKGYKSNRKGKTLEEIYGEKTEKMRKVLEKAREKNMGTPIWNKGKKIKDILGEERKEEIYNKMVKKRKERGNYKHTVEQKKRTSKFFKELKRSEEWKLNRIGEKNPAWLGGKSFEPYDKNFNNQFKRLIRKRDNYVCMVCGIHTEKINGSLSVHHINYNKKLTIKENCISLCHKCHMSTNINRNHWTNFLQNLLVEKYGYKYEEKNIVMVVK